MERHWHLGSRRSALGEGAALGGDDFLSAEGLAVIAQGIAGQADARHAEQA